MVATLILLAIGAVLILAILKFSSSTSKSGFILAVALLLFFVYGFIRVLDVNTITLNSFPNFFLAIKLYVFWIGHLFVNLKTITANAIQMNWLP